AGGRTVGPLSRAGMTGSGGGSLAGWVSVSRLALSWSSLQGGTTRRAWRRRNVRQSEISTTGNGRAAPTLIVLNRVRAVSTALPTGGSAREEAGYQLSGRRRDGLRCLAAA